LTYLDLGTFSTTAVTAISADGAVMVGQSQQGSWIWDAEHGARSLDDVLVDLGVDRSQWLGLVVDLMSGDGKTLAGVADDQSLSGDSAKQTGWIARL
jgi:hypothetical protein